MKKPPTKKQVGGDMGTKVPEGLTVLIEHLIESPPVPRYQASEPEYVGTIPQRVDIPVTPRLKGGEPLPFDPDLQSVTPADVLAALRHLDQHDTITRFETTPIGVYYQVGKNGLADTARDFQSAIVLAAMHLGWTRD